MPRNAAIPAPLERVDQKNLIRWARMERGAHPELRWLYHIENERKRTAAQAREAMEMGMNPGAPDLCLPVARGGFHALYIELKREKGGRLSQNQKEWRQGMRDEGNCALVCYGFEEAREAILAYLEGAKLP